MNNCLHNMGVFNDDSAKLICWLCRKPVKLSQLLRGSATRVELYGMRKYFEWLAERVEMLEKNQVAPDKKQNEEEEWG